MDAAKSILDSKYQNTKPDGSLLKSIVLLGVVTAVIFAAILSISVFRNYEGAIGSHAYHRIIENEDLISDISPPPAFAIEAYVAVLEAIEHSSEAAARFDVFKSNKAKYLERIDYWAKADIPANLRQAITVDAKNILEPFWKVAETTVFPVLIKNPEANVLDEVHKLEDMYAEHRKVIKGAVVEAKNHLAATEAAIAAELSALDWVYRAIITIGILILAGAMVMIVRKVIRPMTNIADFTMDIAEGKANGDVPYLDRNDEIGKIAHALTTLSKASEQKLLAEQEVGKERDRVMKMTEANDAARTKTEQDTAHAVEAIADALQKMVRGDLTGKINEPFEGDLDKLRLNLNTTIDQFADTFKKIIGTTENLNSGVREIVTASDDLSLRTEKQASSLEETAATVGQITETVQQSSEGAENTRNIVEAAKNDAQVSGQVVEKALTAMSEIEESAKEINQIISVIDEIAFQTNLLALNAGVEAARAGEAGQGFAVVASEVRALAQRSAVAAKEIKDLISKSTEQVAGGSKLVGETGKTLHRIADQVLEISSVVGEIASGAKEQHRSLNELNITVSDMDTSTQQNAAMAEQATAACHSLKSEADELTRMMATFNVGDAGSFAASAAPVARSSNAVTEARAPAPASSSNPPKNSPAKALQSRVEGAFSAKPAATDGQQPAKVETKPEPAKKSFSGNTVVKEDDWEEF